MITWVLFLGIGMVVGIVAGMYFARLDDVSNSQKKILQQKLDLAEQQLSTYKSQVSEHFLQTASLVNSMTESYKAVHAHLAAGARELCGNQIAEMQLEMPATKLLDSAPLPPQEKAVAVVDADQNVDETVTAAESGSVASPVDEAAAMSADAQSLEDEPPATNPAAQEPPSTPESLHVVDTDSASLQDSDHNAAPSGVSRMVH